jgi:hypothetical protein
MKRFIVPALVLAVLCCFSFLGCIKNRPYVTTSNPTMTADIGTYKFVASAVRPSTIDTQNFDTSTSLVITGYASDRANPYDKIVLVIANYKGVTGTFSIVQGQAHGAYYHGNSIGKALGGIVAVNNVSTTVTSGYFSFNTDDGIAITNGKFVVNNP